MESVQFNTIKYTYHRCHQNWLPKPLCDTTVGRLRKGSVLLLPFHQTETKQKRTKNTFPVFVSASEWERETKARFQPNPNQILEKSISINYYDIKHKFYIPVV